MRLASYLQSHEQFLAFHAAAFEAVWIYKKNMSDEHEIKNLLESINLDLQIINAAKSDENKQQLKSQTQQAIDKGIFGLPSFFVGDALFFGNDRLPLVEYMLEKL
jgi:2-hydroxychromene-2-carboxylate isomerase